MKQKDLTHLLGCAVAFADSPNDFDNESRETLQVDLDTLYRQVRDGHLTIVPAPTPSEAAAAAKQNQQGATGQALESATPMAELEAMLPSFLDTYGKACAEKSWAPLIALLLTMKAQAERALPHVQQLARAEQAQQKADSTVYGNGANEFSVLLTMEATAYRHVRARGDTPEQAAHFARAAALDEQGAHFELNEGNFVRSDCISVTHVELEDGNLVEPDEGEGAEAPGMGC